MTQQIKSPFYVIQDFISPLATEQIVDDLDLVEPDTDADDKPIMSSKFHEASELTIFNALQDVKDEVLEHYGIKYHGTESVRFEWYPQGSTKHDMRCENSSYLRKQWVRTQVRDITGVLFLSDYQNKVPFDSEYEVYGGVLEFPQHGFGFNPQRGTLILFPSDPHFLNTITEIMYGDLFLARFHIAAESPLVYQPSDFPGDYTKWLERFA